MKRTKKQQSSKDHSAEELKGMQIDHSANELAAG